jgi:hypothetical protein
LIDQYSVTPEVLKGRNAPFRVRLLFLGMIVRCIFREISIISRSGNLHGHFSAPHRDEVLVFSLDQGATFGSE